MTYYDGTPWGYIHLNKKIKEFLTNLEETVTRMQSSNEITPVAYNKIKAEIDNFKNQLRTKSHVV